MVFAVVLCDLSAELEAQVKSYTGNFVRAAVMLIHCPITMTRYVLELIVWSIVGDSFIVLI